MNMYSSHDRAELMPLPKSPAAATGDDRDLQPKPSGGGAAAVEVAAHKPDVDRVGREHRPVWRAQPVGLTRLGPLGRLRRRCWDVGIDPGDSKRASADDLDAVRRADRALEQLHALSGPDDGRVDLQTPERHGPQKLVRDARQRQPGTIEPLELPHQQRGRGAAVLGARVPRAPRELGGADQVAILDEDGLVAGCRGHGGTR
jgi:hypothetical protein